MTFCISWLWEPFCTIKRSDLFPSNCFLVPKPGGETDDTLLGCSVLSCELENWSFNKEIGILCTEQSLPLGLMSVPCSIYFDGDLPAKWSCEDSMVLHTFHTHYPGP